MGIRRLGEIAGGHVHAHRRRHTFAPDLLSKGAPASEVAAILGNSVRIIKKHYAKWIESRQIALEAAVRKAWATGGDVEGKGGTDSRNGGSEGCSD
ncbi:MAG: hypothetical protein ACRD3P_11360 [Terriglobales bacterium]